MKYNYKVKHASGVANLKMAGILTILLTFVGTVAFGQGVQIDTLKLKKSEKFNGTESDKMNFPIIRTGDEKVDSIINFDMKNQFTSNEYPNDLPDATLIKWAGDQIVYLDFEVTYNEKGILSLHINAEKCGAYCSSWTDYFNYATISGEPLNISDIIDTASEFKARVYKDKKSQYKQQKKELLEMLNDPESGLDQPTYECALELYQECENAFDLESFALYPDQLEIIGFCYLPNAIKNLTPVIALKYNYAKIKKYLILKNL